MSKPYLYFTRVGFSDSGKTEIWAACSLVTGDALGVVRWYSPWRAYVFYPHEGTLFNQGCLKQIGDFCANLKKVKVSHA